MRQAIQRLRTHPVWQFAGVLPQADRPLAIAWWGVLLLRGLMPAVFTVVLGDLVGAVQRGEDLTVPLAWMAAVFIPLQVLAPIHTAIGANLGDRTATWLYDRLAVACVRPPGMGHLESPALTSDLTMARDFDLGITGPPLSLSMDFIASGLIEMVGGLACALVLGGYAWWAPLLLAGAWLATHWLLRESGVWRDRNTEEVREAQRHADYAYRLAVDAPAAKELRLFGLASWIIERFRARRRRLFELRWQATRLRERPMIWSLAVVLGANLLLFWSMAEAVLGSALPLDRMVTFAFAAIGTSMIGFGGLSWALDGAAAPTAAVLRLQGAMAAAGALAPSRGSTRPADGMPSREIRFRNVTFAYPGAARAKGDAGKGVSADAAADVDAPPDKAPDNAADRAPDRAPDTATDAASGRGAPVLDGFDLIVPAGSSLAIVGQNGAGKTTLAKLLCRLYDPQRGAIEVDGVDLRDVDLGAWRSRVAAVFQDFIRFELPLRDNIAPGGAPDEAIHAALEEAGASALAGLDAQPVRALDTVLAKGYEGGTDLSGGQWQRVALARALCAVRLGAGLVILDEPTAQLDVRGEAEIFERILATTRHATTILISHRFSTVRQADRICVLEGGRVVELGTHDELMAAGGRYRTMFELQASRFGEEDRTGGEEGAGGFDVLS